MQETQNKINWEDFLKNASIERKSTEEWSVNYETQEFILKYESFVFFPRPLAGATAFLLKKIKQNAKDKFDYEWKIHIKADLRDYPKKELLRVVWSHLDRTEGDYCILYKYNTLDNQIPKGAIGAPKEMIDKIKRWKIQPHTMSVAEAYIYIAPDGCQEDIVLIDTVEGYRWETSVGCNRYNSFKKAENKVIKFLQQPSKSRCSGT